MNLARKIVPGVAAVGLSLGLGSTVFAATSSSTPTTTSSSASSTPAGGQDPSVKDGGKIVTDQTVISAVTGAVQAKSAGATIDRVAKLPDGTYLAFTVQSSQKVIVSLDASYAITASKNVPAGGPNGTGGPGPMNGSRPSGAMGTPPTGQPPSGQPHATSSPSPSASPSPTATPTTNQ